MKQRRLAGPRILLVEDHEPQRKNLHEALELRGFKVWSAGDVATARSHVKNLGSDIDVAVLDMRLEDPADPGVRGTDIGFEIRRHQTANFTEFLILTGFPDLDFMKNALRLGAAAYLHKPMPIPDVIRHIRSLAFRRHITARPIVESRAARRLVETSHSRNHALSRFCQEIVNPSLESIVGTPALLLCSDPTGTRLCGGARKYTDIEPGGFFHTVASLAFGISGTQAPYVVARHAFPTMNEGRDNELLAELEGACVVSLAEIQDFRLSVVLLEAVKPLSENPERLGAIFAGYVRSAVTTQLLGIATLWAELVAHRRTLLAATSRMCLYVGQEQVKLLDSTKGHQEEFAFQQLHDLGEDLYSAGQLLADLYEQTEASGPIENRSRKPVNIMELVDEIWQELSPKADLPLDLLQARGEGVALADRSDLATVIYRLLVWLIRRMQSGAGSPSSIGVSCEQDQEGIRISFRDSSRRLPSHLREHVFLPFAEGDWGSRSSGRCAPDGFRSFLSLYLARALIESRSGGYIEDFTEDLDTEDGHLFVVGLPGSEFFSPTMMPPAAIE